MCTDRRGGIKIMLSFIPKKKDTHAGRVGLGTEDIFQSSLSAGIRLGSERDSTHVANLTN